LVNVTWENTNVVALLDEVKGLKARIAQELRDRPELNELDGLIGKQRARWTEATTDRQVAEGEAREVGNELSKAQRRLDEIPAEAIAVHLTPIQVQGLEKRFADTGRKISPDTLDQAAGSVFKAIGEDERNATERSGDIKTRIEKLLLVFCNTWPAEAQGLDASLEAAPDFMAKLERLETDGLHKLEAVLSSASATANSPKFWPSPTSTRLADWTFRPKRRTSLPKSSPPKPTQRTRERTQTNVSVAGACRRSQKVGFPPRELVANLCSHSVARPASRNQQIC
jgi:hypothetical protein